jgi:hypothetical protein
MSTINATTTGVAATSDTTGDLILQSSTGVVGTTGTGAVNLPSGTTAQRPANPATGSIRINLTTNLLETYYGTGWKSLVNVANTDPVWTTASGTLATITDEYGTYSNIATVQATDADSGQSISYSVSVGSLPAGTALNSSTGVISGNPTNVETSTTSTFTVTANDGAGGVINRSFSIIVNPAQDGATAGRAATSAQAIKTLTGTNTNGVYYINLPTVGATPIYCIMDSAYDGGGWMMTLKATRGTTFNYNSSYWTTNNTLNPTETNQNDGDAKFNTFNYFAAKDMLARWPDIGAGGSISGLGNWIWLENDFIQGARATPLAFHTTPSSYARWNGGTGNGGSGNFIKDAKTFSGWANGVFSSQVDIRFYGFNYTNNQNYSTAARVRWGFGWNENSEGLYPSSGGGAPGSNDVSGGIGMDSNYGSYSAGDKINCCQDTSGINRSARVEIYVR